jgi:hypothetical protein
MCSSQSEGVVIAKSGISWSNLADESSNWKRRVHGGDGCFCRSGPEVGGTKSHWPIPQSRGRLFRSGRCGPGIHLSVVADSLTPYGKVPQVFNTAFYLRNYRSIVPVRSVRFDDCGSRVCNSTQRTRGRVNSVEVITSRCRRIFHSGFCQAVPE